jgi:hypothetical protein
MRIGPHSSTPEGDGKIGIAIGEQVLFNGVMPSLLVEFSRSMLWASGICAVCTGCKLQRKNKCTILNLFLFNLLHTNILRTAQILTPSCYQSAAVASVSLFQARLWQSLAHARLSIRATAIFGDSAVDVELGKFGEGNLRLNESAVVLYFFLLQQRNKFSASQFAHPTANTSGQEPCSHKSGFTRSA